MAVRITESMIPGGFTQENAEKLGDAVTAASATHPDGTVDYALVSYLPSPLRERVLGTSEILMSIPPSVENTYVLFVNLKLGVLAPTEYLWSVALYDDANDPNTPFHTANEAARTEYGIYTLDTQKYEIPSPRKITRVKVTVTIPDGVTLSLQHEIEGTNSDIEALIKRSNAENTAVAGNPDVSRILANDYYYVLTSLLKEKSEIPVNLLASLLYQVVLGNNKALKDSHEKVWNEYLTSVNDWKALVGTRIGIMNAAPHVHYFFLQEPISSPPFKEYQFNASISTEQYEKNIAEKFFDGLPTGNKVDIFNQFRFPKSSLSSARIILEHLKGRHDFSNTVLDKSKHLKTENRECITGLVTEFEKGLQANLDKTSSTASKTYDLMYSRWIQAILGTRFIEYEVIRVNVLDIRSGKPLTNKRVRRVVIHSKNETGDHHYFYNKKDEKEEKEFEFDSKAAVGAKIASQSKDVLKKLGYSIGDANSDTYSENDKKSYKAYWDQRILDGAVEAIPKDKDKQPPEYMLREIVDEYNLHRTTDANGVLNLKIPTFLFRGRKVYVDILFWEFPITLEALRGSTGHISRDSNAEAETGFTVAWKGAPAPDGAPANEKEQRAEWGHYFTGENNQQYNDAVNFGWEVSKGSKKSMLKAVQRLVIKDDENQFTGLNQSLLSKFYGSAEYPVHFVLFGMEWCQPLLDGVVDSKSIERANTVAFINRRRADGEWIRNLNMHIVSRYVGGTDDPYGHYYGFFDVAAPYHRLNVDGTGRRHQGIDLYTTQDSQTDCFAVHGGKIANLTGNSGYANQVQLLMTDAAQKPYFRYAHLTSHIAKLNNTVVLCGQKVGITGRSGFPGDSYPSHMHFELNKANGDDLEPYSVNDLGIPELTIDEYNKEVLPSNKLPLMLPCACSFGGAYNEPIGCNCGNRNVLKSCWAVQEFPYLDDVMNASSNNNSDQHCELVIDAEGVRRFVCPHIFSSADLDVRCQALLKFLCANRGVGGIPDSDYFEPGSVDGVLGNDPSNVAMNLASGIKVTRLVGANNERHGGRLVRIRLNGVTGWIASHLLDADERFTPDVLNGAGLVNVLAAGSVISSTRMAIYAFKQHHGLLSDTDYASNFRRDDAMLALAHDVCGIPAPI